MKMLWAVGLRRGGVAALMVVGLTGGAVASETSSAAPGEDHPAVVAREKPAKPVAYVPPAVSSSPRDGAAVPVDTTVRVTATSGTLQSVRVTDPRGRALSGTLSADRTRWTAGDLLEPGIRYTITSTGSGTMGAVGPKPLSTVRSSFTTQPLALSQQVYPTLTPVDGDTVGVGMPITAHFDIPVRDRAAFERRMHVTSQPAQAGSWNWISDIEARWRPQKYWRPGTTVKVDLDLNGVAAGAGTFGQQDRSATIKIGDAHIYEVSARTDQMKVYSNGKLLRTIPITTGKPGFTTRSGIKVISEKYAVKEMNSETVGIGQGSSEAYDINDVRWAMRLTNSGEFIHAAPWSVSAQGHFNASHGCTGMSTDNAAWLFAMSRPGDVVKTTGTDRQTEPDNGYGDWNVSWAKYQAGSALH